MIWTTEMFAPNEDTCADAKDALTVFPKVLGLPAALIQRDKNQCHWPIGNAKDADFHFCTHARAAGAVYCDLHLAGRAMPRPKRPQLLKSAAHFYEPRNGANF